MNEGLIMLINDIILKKNLNINYDYCEQLL